ncbi:hypothetical protein SM033_00127 [Vibrio phage vB_VpaM_sm033]|nr:hypothetical protein SM033_00127 [Vibrio phage vB_VpaM_sm033]
MQFNTLQDYARRFFFEQQQAKNVLQWALDENKGDTIAIRFLVGQGTSDFFDTLVQPHALKVEYNSDLMFTTITVPNQVVADLLEKKHAWNEPLYFGARGGNPLMLATINAVGYHPDKSSTGMQVFMTPSALTQYKTTDFGDVTLAQLLERYEITYRL